MDYKPGGLDRGYRPEIPESNKQKEVVERRSAPRRSEESSTWQHFYSMPKYRKARKKFMSEHPYCAECGRVASDLDHIRPHKGDLSLFWDKDNWQSLCKSCHSEKTASEDGGFGNKATRSGLIDPRGYKKL